MPLRAFACAFVIFASFLAQATWADGDALRSALAAAGQGKWDEAKTAAEPAGAVATDIIEWQRLRSGGADWADYRAFLERRPDWPGLARLAEEGEAFIPQNADPDDVIAYFDHFPPETGTGLLRLAEAWRAKGKTADEHTIVTAGWLSLLLNTAEREALLARYQDLLKPYHEQRLDMLLWRGASINARAMLPLVDDNWKKLATARIGLREQVKGVDALIETVPEALANDPGLAYERFAWRARKGRNASAIEVILEQTSSAESLGEPERWARRRADLARWSMREGLVDQAYNLASSHHLTEGSRYADLEWLSGFIALRLQNDPAKALPHFRAFRIAVFTPISLGRAGYWEGRALEALGDTEGARVAYEFGGLHQTSFYGQLAAERAGLPMDGILATGGREFPDWKQSGFASSSVLAAALMLQEADNRLLATQFMLHLCEVLDPTELGQLSELALSLNEPYIAVAIAKKAAQRNIVLPRAYFPVPDLFSTDLGIPPELALSIARRESEFNPVVVSHAGARGLMQLMPGTARDMARKVGVDYSRSKLTTDPAYNARLGSAYLKGLIDQFGASWPLITIGYNAGPGRSRRWVEDRGHPGSEHVDVIDWIEMIPFNETRNYVMRVTESLPVYRARLSGEVAPLKLSEELKGQ